MLVVPDLTGQTKRHLATALVPSDRAGGKRHRRTTGRWLSVLPCLQYRPLLPRSFQGGAESGPVEWQAADRTGAWIVDRGHSRHAWAETRGAVLRGSPLQSPG
jgi:hypothetical protein